MGTVKSISIKELGLDKNLEESARLFLDTDNDGSIHTDEVDWNGDGYLDFDYKFFKKVSPDGFDRIQSRLFEVGLVGKLRSKDLLKDKRLGELVDIVKKYAAESHQSANQRVNDPVDTLTEIIGQGYSVKDGLDLMEFILKKSGGMLGRNVSSLKEITSQLNSLGFSAEEVVQLFKDRLAQSRLESKNREGTTDNDIRKTGEFIITSMVENLSDVINPLIEAGYKKDGVKKFLETFSLKVESSFPWQLYYFEKFVSGLQEQGYNSKEIIGFVEKWSAMTEFYFGPYMGEEIPNVIGRLIAMGFNRQDAAVMFLYTNHGYGSLHLEFDKFETKIKKLESGGIDKETICRYARMLPDNVKLEVYDFLESSIFELNEKDAELFSQMFSPKNASEMSSKAEPFKNGIKALEEAGFTREETKELVSFLSKKPETCNPNFLSAAAALEKIGLDYRRIIPAIVDIITNEKSEERSLSMDELLDGFPEALEAAKSAGMTEEEMLNSMKEILAITYCISGHMSGALEVYSELRLLGVDDKETKINLIKQFDYYGSEKYFFKDLAGAIKSLRESGLDKDGILTLLNSLAKTIGNNNKYGAGNVLSSFKLIPDLVRLGYKDLASLEKILLKMSESTESRTAVFEFASVLFSSGFEDIEEIIKFSKELASDKKAFSIVSHIRTVLKDVKIKDSKDFNLIKDNLKFLGKYAGDYYTWTEGGTDNDIWFSKLNIDVRQCSYDKFPLELTEKLNAYVMNSKWPDVELIKGVSILINKLHDADGKLNHCDKIRTNIASNLTPKTAYTLLSYAMADLYTTSFFAIWDNQKIKDVGEWLKEVDPDERDIHRFIVGLCNYNKADVFLSHRGYFFKKAVELVGNGENAQRDTSLLIKLFDKVLPTAGDDEKKGFAQALCDMQLNDLTKLTSSYLIKLYTKKFGLDKYAPELEEIDQSLPEILTPEVPREEWLKDNTLTGKLYFYKDEKWFGIMKKHYGGTSGKGTNGWKVENESDPDTASFYKYVNGVKLRIILARQSFEEENMLDDINDPNIDIMVHRGHSTHLGRTFPSEDPEKIHAKHKLLMGGSCGAFGDIVNSDMFTVYQGNYFMADSNTGEGAVNTKVIDTLMMEVAKGCTNWDCIGKYKKEGIILPNDSSFLMGGYISALEGLERLRQKAQEEE